MSADPEKLITVYRAPGPHFGPPHTTYDCKGVTEEDLQAALDDGWHLEFLDAIAAEYGSDAVDETDWDAAPTRVELMQQAQMLGLKVDRRWSDETLLAKITATTASRTESPSNEPV